MSQLHDRPSAAALVAALRHFLRTCLEQPDVAPTPFMLRVAANVAVIVERELQLGPAQHTRHARLLADLGVAGEAELAAGVRAGRFDGRTGDVADAIRDTVRMRLAVDHPGYDRSV